MRYGNKQNNGQRKKRKYHGNQHTKTKHISDDPESGSEINTSASAKKLKMDMSAEHTDTSCDDYFVLINFSILKDMFMSMTKCTTCGDSLSVTDKFSSRMGFAHCIEISCSSCGNVQSFYTSKQCVRQQKSNGRQIFEANIRAIVSFREIGRGFQALERFSECMNMYCLAENAFLNLNPNQVYKAYDSVARNSMKRAADDLQDDTPGPTKKRVKIDGTWQKRGHASLNGIVTVVVEEKCVDYKAFSKHFSGCTMWDSKKGSLQYDRWAAEHVCHINHQKSSGLMESAGAIEMFQRSVEKNNLIYHEYLGDGNTSSFKDVVSANPYEEYLISPVKLECVGHVQKRLGTRLRNIVKAHKGTSTPLSGRGKLTDNIINSMQNFYGMAIRKNSGQLYPMKKAIGAILFHCTDIKNQELRHRMCPRDEETWCKYQLDKLKGTKTYKDKISIPYYIHNIIKPIFKDLSNDELLMKCLHGQTQNTNEALNSIIWTRCPKNVFVNRSTLEIGVNSAIIHFNNGSIGVTEVFNHFGLSGDVTVKKSQERNKDRINRMNKKSTNKIKKRRKRLRTIKKGFSDREEETEVTESYVPGRF